jgi:hypothetical protein
MRNGIRAATSGAGLLLLLGGCVVNAPPVAETTVDGLERRQAKQVDTLYVLPGASLAPYKQVMLDSVELAFKADWQARHPEVTVSDITRIRSQGAGVFYEIFSAALTRQHGYPITTQPTRRCAFPRPSPNSTSRPHRALPAPNTCIWYHRLT